MKKLDYLQLAISKGLYKKRPWIITAFTVTTQNPDTVKPYYIYHTPTGLFFKDESNQQVQLEDCAVNTPAFIFRDKIVIDNTWCPNVTGKIETLIGNLLFNLTCVVNGFGTKIPFVTGKVNISKLEEYIAPRLTDVPADTVTRSNDLIYVDEYIKFTDSLAFLAGLADICVWAITERTITAPPNVKEVRDQLLAKYKGRLHDPAVMVAIEEELMKLDAEYLKGDPGGDYYATSAKMRGIVRKKMFLMFGAEAGMGEESTTVDPIFTSLEEGWPVEKFRELNNSLRAGSYGRGAETQLGGLLTKTLLRATSNIQVVEGDCGSKLGIKRKMTEQNYAKLAGVYVIEDNKSILIPDTETAKKYIGKTVYKRSPAYCKTPNGDFCEVCLGKKLSASKTGLSLAVSALGSSILYIFMGKIHGKKMSVAKLKIAETLS